MDVDVPDSEEIKHSHVKPKTPIRYIAFMIWLALMVMFSICYGMLLYYYRIFQTYDDTPLTFPIALILLISISVITIFFFPFLFRGKPFKIKVFWHVTILIGLAAPAFFMTVDNPPLTDDFTMADVITHEPAFIETYNLFESLYKNFCSHKQLIDNQIFRSPYAWMDPLSHDQEIENAWAVISNERQIIDELYKSAGLSDVDFAEPYKTMNEGDCCGYWFIKDIGKIYAAYSMLQIENGRTESGLKHLIKVHTVARKSLASSINISRSQWAAVINQNLTCAYKIIQSQHCTEKILQSLITAFTPLSLEEISMARRIKFDYLCDKYSLTSAYTKIPPIIRNLLISPNKTLQWVFDYYQLVIQGCDNHPPNIEAAEELWMEHNQRLYSTIPPFINMGGEIFMGIFSGSYIGGEVEAIFKMKVRSDLLAKELTAAMGISQGMTDSYCPQRVYLFNEVVGQFVSVGKDCEKGTADDISITTEYGSSALNGPKYLSDTLKKAGINRRNIVAIQRLVEYPGHRLRVLYRQNKKDNAEIKERHLYHDGDKYILISTAQL